MAESSPQPGSTQPFVWPPRAAPVEPSRPTRGKALASSSRPARTTASRSEPQSIWRAIESVWLDLHTPPLLDRAATAAWKSDPADGSAYCPRCGISASVRDVSDAGCGHCDQSRLAWSRMVRLGAFETPLRTWIHEVKYTRWRRLGHDLGCLLGERLAESVAHVSRGFRRAPNPVLVPIPDAGLRRISRGIDHAMVLARGVGSITGWPIIQPLRRRFGASQVSVAPSERASNVARSFALRRGRSNLPPPDSLVILVDDVCTTGATLRTCARLISNGCKHLDQTERPTIWAAVLARADPPDSPNQGARRSPLRSQAGHPPNP